METRLESGRGVRYATLAKRALAALIAALCLYAIMHAFKGQSPASVMAALSNTPPQRLLLGGAFVACNFLVMTGMEMLALRDAGVGLSLRRSAVCAFTGNALSVAAGLGPISGASVRAGLFRRWGLPASAAAATALSVTVMSLSGGALVAAIGCALQPHIAASAFHAPAEIVRVVGIGFMIAVVAALIASGAKRTRFSLFGIEISAPSAGGAIVRVGLGVIDWLMSATAFLVFLGLPAGALRLSFYAAFASAHFAGMAAGAPAGLGVFDALMLGADLTATVPQIAAALFLYRLVANVTPALLALPPYLYLSQVPKAAPA